MTRRGCLSRLIFSQSGKRTDRWRRDWDTLLTPPIAAFMRGNIQRITLLSIVGILPIYSADLQTYPISKNARRIERSADAMGTSFVIEIYGIDEHLMQAAADQAFAEMRRVDEM